MNEIDTATDELNKIHSSLQRENVALSDEDYQFQK